MNAYAKRQAERERLAAARRKEIKEESDYTHAMIADQYEKAHRRLYKSDVEVKYINGWYVVRLSSPGWASRFRVKDIIKATQELNIRADVIVNEEQIEHPEYLTEKD